MSATVKSFTASLVFAAMIGPALAESCASKIDPKKPIDAMIACLGQLEAENGELKEKLERVSVGLTQSETKNKVQLPKGVIVMSALKCSELGDGWKTFREGTGRFIVGAGDETHRAYGAWNAQLPQGGVQPVPLSTYVVLSQGGEEAHLLSKPEMPSHFHLFTATQPGGGCSYSGCNGKTDVVSRQTEMAGGDAAHNTMPPYVALYFCAKD